MNTFAILIFVAIAIEAIINIINNIEEKQTSWKYWLSLILGLGLSVLVAYNWNLDLFSLIGLPDGQIPYLGAVLTGLILSRGSNVVSDLIGLIDLKEVQRANSI